MSVHEVKLTPSEIDAIVSRVAELLQSRRAARPVRLQPRMVTAAEVAQWCGVERSWVYAHAEELGARKIGTGERPWLRFDPAEVSERIAALGGSQTGSGRGSTAIAADSRNRSLPRRRRGIVVGQGTDGRAARKRPRPGAEGKASTR
jgi:predicted DNA-binding transcriptional regulator AlpA